MSGTGKSVSKISRRTSTLFHNTEALLKAADPQQIPQIMLQLLQQLNGKVELHVHLTINSGSNFGNIICGNDNKVGAIQCVQVGSDNNAGNISQSIY
jgi:hypothetical protein